MQIDFNTGMSDIKGTHKKMINAIYETTNYLPVNLQRPLDTIIVKTSLNQQLCKWFSLFLSICKENLDKTEYQKLRKRTTLTVTTLFYPDQRNIKCPRRLDKKFFRANIPDMKFFIVPHLKNDSEKKVIHVKTTLFVLRF